MKSLDLLGCVLLCTLLLVSPAIAEEATGEPIDVGYQETIDSRLIEVPLTLAVRGMIDRGLTTKLEVWVGDRRVDGFQIQLGNGRIVQYGRPADDFMTVLPASNVRNGDSASTLPPQPRPPFTKTGFAPDGSSRFSKTITKNRCDDPPWLVPVKPSSATVGGGGYVAETLFDSRSLEGGTWRRPTGGISLGFLTLNGVEMPDSPALRVVSPTKFLRIGAASYGERGTARREGVQATLVPTSFNDGSYDALAQVSIADPGEAAGSWLVTLSIRSGATSQVLWGRIDSKGGEQRVVLQDTIELPSGDYTMIAQAHHVESGETREIQLEGDLQKPRKKKAVLGPVAVLQKGDATVLRAGQDPTADTAFALAAGEALAPDRESVVLASLCGGRRGDEAWTVQREMLGPSSTEFPATQIEASDDECVLLADRIPADGLAAGDYSYVIRVAGSDGLIAEQSSDWVVDADPVVVATAAP